MLEHFTLSVLSKKRRLFSLEKRCRRSHEIIVNILTIKHIHTRRNQSVNPVLTLLLYSLKYVLQIIHQCGSDKTCLSVKANPLC